MATFWAGPALATGALLAVAAVTVTLSGALSDYVRPEHRGTISALFPRARLARIPGAGHWLHADKPREFEAAIVAWLDATEAEVTS